MSDPLVSVVMAVHNGSRRLDDAVQSVLSQDGVDLELICVDDGSTDATPDLLTAIAARDSRVRVLRQPHAGLTAALVRGCEAARGELIARQDAGDRSLPGRLASQAEVHRTEPETAFVCGSTRVVTDDGIALHEIGGAGRTARGTLPEATSWPGPSHHGATMFRRAAYAEVGGYRRAFGVAQDFDLWLRLLEVGDFVSLPAVLYEATFTPASLSGAHRREQLRNARIALDCALARRSGGSEASLLARCAGPPRSAAPSSRRRAEAHYFVGACLRERPELARRHFLLAVRAWPLHFRAWWRLARTGTSAPVAPRDQVETTARRSP